MDIDDDGEHVDRPPTFALNVLQLVRLAQAQHGMRHSDYTRYRHYCSKRLRTLYKKLKMLHGRQKYQKKRVEAANVTCERHLHVSLVCAERAWAHGMELKKDIENGPGKASSSSSRKRPHPGKGGVSSVKRRHMLARFKKASAFATEFSGLCAQRGGTKTALEAEGYSAMMAGLWKMEVPDWQEALNKLLRAKKLFEELAKVGEFDQQALFHQVLEELEPSVRFCIYNLERAQGGAAVQLQEVDLEHLESKLASLVVEAKSQAQQEQTASSLEWCKIKYPVRSEMLRNSLQHALDAEGQLRAAGDPLALYDKVVSAYGELKRLVQQALNAGGGTTTLGLGSDLSDLATAVNGTLLQHSIQKSLLLLQKEQKNFEDGMLQALQASKRSKDKASRSKPGDVVRLHDTLIGHITELIELGMKIGGAQGEVLMEQYAAKAAHYQASRCYFVAHTHLAGKRLKEAHALFDRCTKRAEDAIARYKECSEQDPDAVDALTALSKKAAAFRCCARAEYAEELLLVEQRTRQGMESLSLGDQDGTPTAGSEEVRYLSDNMDSWESFVGPGRSVRIFRIPPALYSMPVKPIFLDTALNHIERPSLDQRLPKKTTFSRMLGWAGW
ncbi:unnamed protein product [Ostreobium quekettii]|uniref:Signal recognition particle subunit SRP68 n=1 Tax=Ostreobium quekettii TaxID=121088 RepID=A0A8S1J6M3_9CHLO|nr:unnamed protein product [Ostreobium quekettii]|eukprot:evm.model.scf_819.4 EVM.evm.TU.scf_819.4   scf_819:20358-27338(-)